MNREHRRKLNKKNKLNLNKEEWERAMALACVNAPARKRADIDLMQEYVDYDDPDKYPEGTVVKISPDIKLDDKEQPFKDWVTSHMETEMHIVRDGNRQALVSLLEDTHTFTDDNGEQKEAPKWHFSLNHDLLVKTSNGWMKAMEILGSEAPIEVIVENQEKEEEKNEEVLEK